jgi:uncharacterized protein YihD (DUF1040 family)
MCSTPELNPRWRTYDDASLADLLSKLEDSVEGQQKWLDDLTDEAESLAARLDVVLRDQTCARRHLEATQRQYDLVEAEASARELDDAHPDSDSLEDRGLTLGSYAG